MHCEVACPDIGLDSVCLQEIGGCGVLGILTSSRKSANFVLTKVAELVKRKCSTSGSMTSGALPAGTTGPRHPDLEAAALGSAALVFFAGRASSPRDLSAAACSELREGCWQLLKDMY